MPALLAVGRTGQHDLAFTLLVEKSRTLIESIPRSNNWSNVQKSQETGTRYQADSNRTAFSVRFKVALRAIGCEPTPTQVAKGFNMRRPASGITPQAARKWLLGLAYPTGANLMDLAKWLDVDPAWLRFGETGQRPGPRLVARPDSLTADIALLNPQERVLLRKMLDLILQARKFRDAPQ